MESYRADYVISPQQTLGLPKVGRNQKATDWAKKKYKELSSDDVCNGKEFKDKYPNLAIWLNAMEGAYVDELVPDENRDGIGAVTGIFVGSESFRGKQLNFVPWLEDYEDELCWYNNKTPDELTDMGYALQGILEERIQETPSVGESEAQEETHSRELIEAASKWCIFWGSHGHSMYAWY